ncbi:MAG TPA: hypothetical protein VH352_19990 [Pseudonocardiaceae bacterium]|nr:hypothetical protein [Pseudonocardiaceae bacterium]
MVDPILISIATTLATKAAGSLYDLVRSAFHRHPKAAAALVAAEDAEPESASVHALAERLAEVEAAEPAFHAKLRAEWQRLDGVTNTISGSVTGNVVQAGDIHGGIKFGP